jgi:hypothetical protein
MAAQSEILVRQLNTSTTTFQRTVERLDADFVQKSATGTNAITGAEEFSELYGATSDLYRSEFQEVWCQYGPLYNTIWRQDLQIPLKEDNLHQDEIGCSLLKVNGRRHAFLHQASRATGGQHPRERARRPIRSEKACAQIFSISRGDGYRL